MSVCNIVGQIAQKYMTCPGKNILIIFIYIVYLFTTRLTLIMRQSVGQSRAEPKAITAIYPSPIIKKEQS